MLCASPWLPVGFFFHSTQIVLTHPHTRCKELQVVFETLLKDPVP